MTQLLTTHCHTDGGSKNLRTDHTPTAMKCFVCSPLPVQKRHDWLSPFSSINRMFTLLKSQERLTATSSFSTCNITRRSASNRPTLGCKAVTILTCFNLKLWAILIFFQPVNTRPDDNPLVMLSAWLDLSTSRCRRNTNPSIIALGNEYLLSTYDLTDTEWFWLALCTHRWMIFRVQALESVSAVNLRPKKHTGSLISAKIHRELL